MHLSRLYLIPGIRERVAKFRFYALTSTRQLTKSSDSSFIERWDYSLKHLNKYKSIRERIDFLVSALANTIRLSRDCRLLVLGPRYETELFGYRALGIRKKNIVALDSFSYSSLVEVGNLHNLPFLKETFDVVICGWTLAYSENLSVAFQQIYKVLKPGGVFILSFDMQSTEIPQKLIDVYIPNYGSPFQSVFHKQFLVRNYFIGKTSWSDVDICCISLQKL